MSQPSSWLSKGGLIVGLAAALFTLNALAFDSEVDRKIGHAQQLSTQQHAAVLHNLRLLSQRQTVESLAGEIRLEEFLQTWYAAERRRETEAGRLYEIERQLARSQRRLVALYERYNNASEQLEALHAGPP